MPLSLVRPVPVLTPLKTDNNPYWADRTRPAAGPAGQERHFHPFFVLGQRLEKWLVARKRRVREVAAE